MTHQLVIEGTKQLAMMKDSVKNRWYQYRVVYSRQIVCTYIAQLNTVFVWQDTNLTSVHLRFVSLLVPRNPFQSLPFPSLPFQEHKSLFPDAGQHPSSRVAWGHGTEFPVHQSPPIERPAHH